MVRVVVFRGGRVEGVIPVPPEVDDVLGLIEGLRTLYDRVVLVVP